MKILSNEHLDMYLGGCTHPLYLQDAFLSTGHNEKTHNGTATFIKFQGQHYVCTARHVLEELNNPKVVGEAITPVPALMIGQSVLNFSVNDSRRRSFNFFHPDDSVDISISLVESHWEFISERGGRRAVDLDNWKEPQWKQIKQCVTVGYFDKKRLDGDRVISKIARITADMSSTPRRDCREFTLSTTLQYEHGYFFSGISGGPIFATISDEELCMIGIVHESPHGKEENVQIDGFFSPKDLVIRGVLVTPEKFADWLKTADHT